MTDKKIPGIKEIKNEEDVLVIRLDNGILLLVSARYSEYENCSSLLVEVFDEKNKPIFDGSITDIFTGFSDYNEKLAGKLQTIQLLNKE